MLEDVLPQNFAYKIIKGSITDSENFNCELRCSTKNGEEFSQWFKEFEEKTNTSWIVRTSVACKENAKYLFSKDYVCQHSSFRKKIVDGKDKNCLASLSVRIKRNTKDTRYKDDLIKEGLCTIIKLNFQHSHVINAPEAWSWLPRSEDTKKKFIELFESGMTPYDARRHHEHLISTESSDLLASSRINPPDKWIYRMYKKWLSEKCTRHDSRSDPESPTVSSVTRVSTGIKPTTTDLQPTTTDMCATSDANTSEPVLAEDFKSPEIIYLTSHKQKNLQFFCNMMEDMKRISAIVEDSGDSGVTPLLEKFAKKLSNVETMADVYAFFSEQTVTRRKKRKKVLPTPVDDKSSNCKKICTHNNIRPQNNDNVFSNKAKDALRRRDTVM